MNPIVQIRIIMGTYWNPTYIIIRRAQDLEFNLRGTSYRQPEPTSYMRLARLLFEKGVPCFVDFDRGEIVFGNQSPMPERFSFLAGKDVEYR